MRPSTTGQGSRRHLIILIAIILGVLVFAIAMYAGSVLFDRASRSANPGDLDTARDVPEFQLERGNCVEALEYVVGDVLRQIPCALPHLAEVVAEQEIDDAEYTLSSNYSQQAEEFCLPAAYDAVPAEMDTGPLTTRYLYPTRSSWEEGHRSLQCVITVAEGHHLTGSFVAGDASLHDEGL